MSGGVVELRGAGFSHGPRTVLSDVSVTVGPQTRLAVVGPNGVGKSTLLSLLAGRLEAETGSVVLSPPAATVVLLPQERDRRPAETLGQYLARRTGVAGAEAALAEAASRLAEGATGADDAYALALERYLSLGGPDLDARAPAVLERLGLDAALLDRTTGSFSGGQLARAGLAAVLLAQVDVLLLDEPTNDLDTEGLELLEGFLARRAGGLVAVSHDRTFLERVATAVLEIDEFTHRAALYGGGFAAYLEERERARAAAKAAFEAYDEARTGLVDRARREKEWARQGVSRATSARARRAEPDKNVRAAKVAGAQSRGAAAARTLRALGRLEEVEDPRDSWELRLSLQPASRGSDDVAGLAAAVVERGVFRLGPVDLKVHRSERVAVTGANGSGKTTLLGALIGRVPLTSGRAWLGRSVVVGEVDQVRTTFPPDQPLGAAFRAATGQVEAESRTLLAKFGLGADDVARPVRSLSPGERTRADLALLMARRANLLVLDEPTNHLDLAAIEQLEEALSTYDGTLLLVSHDRRLLDQVHTDRHLHVDGGQVAEL
ncbi:MAG TPA: ABC-F family ATP-binding cassette domain-containing protein [Actinomycetes bacterium]